MAPSCELFWWVVLSRVNGSSNVICRKGRVWQQAARPVEEKLGHATKRAGIDSVPQRPGRRLPGLSSPPRLPLCTRHEGPHRVERLWVWSNSLPSSWPPPWVLWRGGGRMASWAVQHASLWPPQLQATRLSWGGDGPCNDGADGDGPQAVTSLPSSPPATQLPSQPGWSRPLPPRPPVQRAPALPEPAGDVPAPAGLALPGAWASPASHPGLRPRAADVPAPGAQQRAPTGRIGLLRRLRSSSTELVRPLLIVGLPGLTCSWFELLVDPGEGACQAGTALSPEPARAAPRWSPRWPPSPSTPWPPHAPAWTTGRMGSAGPADQLWWHQHGRVHRTGRLAGTWLRDGGNSGALLSWGPNCLSRGSWRPSPVSRPSAGSSRLGARQIIFGEPFPPPLNTLLTS